MYIIKAKLLSIGDDFDITDDSGRVAYHVDGKAFSMRNKLVIEDPAGQEVATIERHLVALRPDVRRHHRRREGGRRPQALFTPFGERFTVDIPGPATSSSTATCSTTSSRSSATASRWRRCRSGGSACATPMASGSPEGENDLLVLASVLAVDLAMARERKDNDNN
jgi:hypothetical protein